MRKTELKQQKWGRIWRNWLKICKMGKKDRRIGNAGDNRREEWKVETQWKGGKREKLKRKLKKMWK